MADIVSALGLHGVPELFRRPNDVDRFKGSKAVIAIMAANRTHPEFQKAEAYYTDLNDHEHLALLEEDQADGPLHERFHCAPGDFCFALINMEGKTIMRLDHSPPMKIIQERLGDLI